MQAEMIDIDNLMVQDAMVWATGRMVMSWFEPVDGHLHPVAIQCFPPSRTKSALWEIDFSESNGGWK